MQSCLSIVGTLQILRFLLEVIKILCKIEFPIVFNLFFLALSLISYQFLNPQNKKPSPDEERVQLASVYDYIIILRYITRRAGQPLTFFRSIKVLWSEMSLVMVTTPALVSAGFINWPLCKSSRKVESGDMQD